MSERIDRIYDKLVAAEDLKNGTKYERLAALVFQILDRSTIVIHDVILRGDGKVTPHQIDVTASSRSGTRTRVIVEARDREKPVGLGQVRDFFAVTHQLRPDHAWIVSTSGFTEKAQGFAREEGIGLAVLRPAEKHEDNRLKAIHFRGHIQAVETPTITRWLASDDAERERVAPLIAEQEGTVQLVDATEQVVFSANGESAGSLQEVLEPIFDTFDLEIGTNEGSYEFDEILLIDIAGVRAAVRGFEYRVEVTQARHDFTVGDPSSVAELIVQSIDGTVTESVDRVIYDTELQGLAVNEDGRVVHRPQ